MNLEYGILRKTIRTYVTNLRFTWPVILSYLKLKMYFTGWFLVALLSFMFNAIIRQLNSTLPTQDKDQALFERLVTCIREQ